MPRGSGHILRTGWTLGPGHTNPGRSPGYRCECHSNLCPSTLLWHLSQLCSTQEILGTGGGGFFALTILPPTLTNSLLACRCRPFLSLPSFLPPCTGRGSGGRQRAWHGSRLCLPGSTRVPGTASSPRFLGASAPRSTGRSLRTWPTPPGNPKSHSTPSCSPPPGASPCLFGSSFHAPAGWVLHAGVRSSAAPEPCWTPLRLPPWGGAFRL